MSNEEKLVRKIKQMHAVIQFFLEENETLHGAIASLQDRNNKIMNLLPKEAFGITRPEVEDDQG